MDIQFNSVDQLIAVAKRLNKPFWEVMLMKEIERGEMTESEILNEMEKSLQVMEKSLLGGLNGVSSITGLSGYDAVKLNEYLKRGNSLSGDPVLTAACYAIAVNEWNSSMGVICAAPTAGSCGVVPGVLFTLRDKIGLSREKMIRFLLTSGAFGLIIANNASISGASGGCQAEVGSAAAMAAAATVEVMGGTLEQSANACAIAFKNLLGLVCDPVAGLVEVPCIKRNAIGVANAMVAADMALAGIESKIPCDEVIEAMNNVGKQMPENVRETALGGLASTPTGKKYQEEIFGK